MAVVLAGGSGTRMGADRNKVYLPLVGRTVLAWSLATLERSPLVDDVVLVVRADDVDDAAAVVRQSGIKKLRVIVEGGPTRTASEQAGIGAVRTLRSRPLDIGHVLIHDAARPFVTLTLIDALVRAARRDGGAVPALALADTPYHLDDSGTLLAVTSSDLVRVQTPQVFAVEPLLHAYELAARYTSDAVDTAAVVEKFVGTRIAAVPGDERNIKLTTATDLVAAEVLAARWRDGDWIA